MGPTFRPSNKTRKGKKTFQVEKLIHFTKEKKKEGKVKNHEGMWDIVVNMIKLKGYPWCEGFQWMGSPPSSKRVG